MSVSGDIKPISIIRPRGRDIRHMPAVERKAVLQSLVYRASQVTLTPEEAGFIVDCLVSPALVKDKLLRILSGSAHWVHLAGPVEDRTIFVGTSQLSGIAASFGESMATISSSRSNAVTLKPIEGFSHLAEFSLSSQQYFHLTRPRVLLAALYHPENFPLPRFPLGISDLARSLREEWIGEVVLHDMQLGETIDSILDKILTYEPDLVGISATFGQYDLLQELLTRIKLLPIQPTVMVGGSLGVLVHEGLLKDRLAHFVGTGAGELTVLDIARYSIDQIDKCDIPDVAFLNEAAEVVKTGRTKNKNIPSMIPELDLLPTTLAASGVMQLESSRGCSYACSFCPREHKGMWAGENAFALSRILPAIGAIYELFPEIDRRIFLVDEEFVGYQEEHLALGRCTAVASQLAAYGFRFETSSRIDQVYRPRRDKHWHLGRMRFWLELSRMGLDRCLFGVESGVDSILERFNKKTNSEQNIRAIRILSLLGIPIRCTYITFDPLMSVEELGETIRFLGRTDLLLPPLSNVDQNLELALELACDDSASAEYSNGTPFYHAVSYMGVSMEALLGSKYLQMVEKAGLAGEINPLMGRREASYLDTRIGDLSLLSQLWVDRHFSLDYTLKSLEKVTGRDTKRALRECRVALKAASYNFIAWAYRSSFERAESTLVTQDALSHHLQNLIAQLDPMLNEAIHSLDDERGGLLSQAHREWVERREWRLINGMCTT